MVSKAFTVTLRFSPRPMLKCFSLSRVEKMLLIRFRWMFVLSLIMILISGSLLSVLKNGLKRCSFLNLFLRLILCILLLTLFPLPVLLRLFLMRDFFVEFLVYLIMAVAGVAAISNMFLR